MRALLALAATALLSGQAQATDNVAAAQAALNAIIAEHAAAGAKTISTATALQELSALASGYGAQGFSHVAAVQQFQSFPIQSFVQTQQFAVPTVQTFTSVPFVQSFVNTHCVALPQVVDVNVFNTRQRLAVRSSFVQRQVLNNRIGRRVVRQRIVTRGF